MDGFFPRQFAFRGDRLAFSMGIVALGLIAASLVVIFGGQTHALIPLYAVGVFIDFTIAQAGMIRHWLRTRDRRLAAAPRHQRRSAVSPTAHRGGRRDDHQVRRRRVARGAADPDPRRP